jgi:hypothetical protein
VIEESSLLVNVAVPVGVLLLTFRLIVRINHLHTVLYPIGLESWSLALILKGNDDPILRFVFLGL